MPCLITTLTRCAIKKTTIQKATKNKQKQKFQGKTQYLNLKAPSKNVKRQSDETLTTESYFFLTLQQMAIFFNESR